MRHNADNMLQASCQHSQREPPSLCWVRLPAHRITRFGVSRGQALSLAESCREVQRRLFPIADSTPQVVLSVPKCQASKTYVVVVRLCAASGLRHKPLTTCANADNSSAVKRGVSPLVALKAVFLSCKQADRRRLQIFRRCRTICKTCRHKRELLESQ